MTATNDRLKEGSTNEPIEVTHLNTKYMQNDQDLEIMTDQTKQVTTEESKMTMKNVHKKGTSLTIDNIILDQYCIDSGTVPEVLSNDSPNTIKKAERMGVFTLNTSNRNYHD